MTAEEMNVYKMRITQAGVGELTLIMLEMEMQWISEAIEYCTKGDMEQYRESLEKAQSVQVELMNVLNMSNATARQVHAVFVYINKVLIVSRWESQPEELDRCKAMLVKYYTAFQKVAQTDKGGPVMAGSEKVYAGLTYGSSGLVESSVGGTEYTV